MKSVRQLAFSKIFKQHCKMSPKMYKEEKSELVFTNDKDEYQNPIL